MKKILTGLFLSTIFSLSALAIEGHGYKIITEKITQSPEFHGGFQKTNPKKNIPETSETLRVNK